MSASLQPELLYLQTIRDILSIFVCLQNDRLYFYCQAFSVSYCDNDNSKEFPSVNFFVTDPIYTVLQHDQTARNVITDGQKRQSGKQADQPRKFALIERICDSLKKSLFLKKKDASKKGELYTAQITPLSSLTFTRSLSYLQLRVCNNLHIITVRRRLRLQSSTKRFSCQLNI